MNCSIISDRIGITLNAEAANEAGMDGVLQKNCGSALQNPDISRLQLKTLLRGKAQAISTRARKHFWTTLLNEQTSRSAND